MVIEKSQGELTYLEVSNEAATAKIALQGAHIFFYKMVDDAPLLWVSSASAFKKGVAIRGGVPICWPSFGMNNPELPQHGFARTALWKFDIAEELDEVTTRLHFSLEDNEQTRGLWAHKFRVEYVVTVGQTLKMELRTINLDKDPFTITQALHTYFDISSIEDVVISGLENKNYLDALTQQEQTQEGAISFDQELDRVYQGVEQIIKLKDAKRTIRIKNSGSKSVVVWNPWIEKCARMSGMEPEGYKEFVCIESANAFEDMRVIAPQGTHTLEAEIF